MKYFLMSICVFYYTLSIHAQTCDPNDLYDQIVSDFHSTVARRQDGSLAIWGEGKASDGNSNVLIPQEINAVNYPGLTGIPLKAALGSYGSPATSTVPKEPSINLSNSQAILLTTTGLFAWGIPNTVIPFNVAPGKPFKKITVAGKTDGLPPNVSPAQIKIMTATYNSLAIVTDSGHVWILGSITPLYGDGSTATSNSWHHVKTAIAPYPFLTGIVQLRISTFGAFAVDSNNIWYTWGRRVFNGTSLGTSSRAIVVKQPVSNNKLPKMIGITSNTDNNTAYFVLTQSGDLYAVGDGAEGILGNGSTTDQLEWGKVRKSSTEELTNVNFISVQEHDGILLSAAAITTDNKLFYWGADDFAVVSGPRAYSSYAQIPAGFTVNVDKANYVEQGGHTLVYVKDGSSHYCYLGHRVNGSMGDGVAANAFELSMNCTNTAAVPLCSLCPATAHNTINQNQKSVCAGYTVNDLVGENATLSNNNPVFYQWQFSTTSKDTLFTNITAATAKNYTPSPLTTTTWFRRFATNQTPNCPFDSSNVIKVVVNTLPLTPLVISNAHVCGGDSIVLHSSASPNVQYNWTGPDNFVSALQNPVIYTASASNTGMYALNVIDTNACISATASTDVTVHIIETKIATPASVCEGRSILLEVSNPSTDWAYLWTGPNGFVSDKKSPLITNAIGSKMGLYNVRITDTTKCSVSEFITISLANCEDSFTVPEGFSPNGDGINDLLIIRGLSMYPNHSIVIFNRWGEKVFSAAPYKNDWQGLSQFGLVVGVGAGESLPEGTYFYLLDKQNGEEPVKGSIYLKK